jgi:hypothetical protein
MVKSVKEKLLIFFSVKRISIALSKDEKFPIKMKSIQAKKH